MPGAHVYTEPVTRLRVPRLNGASLLHEVIGARLVGGLEQQLRAVARGEQQWTGKTVYHCHILPHEDTGMMGNLLIEA